MLASAATLRWTAATDSDGIVTEREVGGDVDLPQTPWAAWHGVCQQRQAFAMPSGSPPLARTWQNRFLPMAAA
jgi:hypothetical protein